MLCLCLTMPHALRNRLSEIAYFKTIQLLILSINITVTFLHMFFQSIGFWLFTHLFKMQLGSRAVLGVGQVGCRHRIAVLFVGVSPQITWINPEWVELSWLLLCWRLDCNLQLQTVYSEFLSFSRIIRIIHVFRLHASRVWFRYLIYD